MHDNKLLTGKDAWIYFVLSKTKLLKLTGQVLLPKLEVCLDTIQSSCEFPNWSTSGFCSSSGGGFTSTSSSLAMGACIKAGHQMSAVITSHLLIKLNVRRIFKLMCEGVEAHVAKSRSKIRCLKLLSRILAFKLASPS